MPKPPMVMFFKILIATFMGVRFIVGIAKKSV